MLISTLLVAVRRAKKSRAGLPTGAPTMKNEGLDWRNAGLSFLVLEIAVSGIRWSTETDEKSSRLDQDEFVH